MQFDINQLLPTGDIFMTESILTLELPNKKYFSISPRAQILYSIISINSNNIQQDS
jgi:hypothetical protein